MNSSLIGKIEKARRYTDERAERISFEGFVVRFRGDNAVHRVQFKDGAFSCDCSFFPRWGTCSHTMALERILAGMVPESLEGARS
ncbi:MAG: hypothetical protein HY688_05040 [Chloroflexi bacterium]|nr:hypothetical protein [Chloroflexota bacterium]